MKIKRITYSRTSRLPNHENEKIEVSAELTGDDNPDHVFADLKEFALAKLGRRSPTAMENAFNAAREPESY